MPNINNDPRGNDQFWKDVGLPCCVCGQVVTVVELDCNGAKERNEPLPLQQVCSCIHPGDLMCNCGKPCRSFF